MCTNTNHTNAVHIFSRYKLYANSSNATRARINMNINNHHFSGSRKILNHYKYLYASAPISTGREDIIQYYARKRFAKSLCVAIKSILLYNMTCCEIRIMTSNRSENAYPAIKKREWVYTVIHRGILCSLRATPTMQRKNAVVHIGILIWHYFRVDNRANAYSHLEPTACVCTMITKI